MVNNKANGQVNKKSMKCFLIIMIIVVIGFHLEKFWIIVESTFFCIMALLSELQHRFFIYSLVSPLSDVWLYLALFVCWRAQLTWSERREKSARRIWRFSTTAAPVLQERSGTIHWPAKSCTHTRCKQAAAHIRCLLSSCLTTTRNQCCCFFLKCESANNNQDFLHFFLVENDFSTGFDILMFSLIQCNGTTWYKGNHIIVTNYAQAAKSGW